MARVAILQNFNDTLANPLPAGTNPIPVAGWVSVSGAEINAVQVTDDNFAGGGSATVAGASLVKNYGKASATEARFLQRRLMGY